jgi:hypothetical protein
MKSIFNSEFLISLIPCARAEEMSVIEMILKRKSLGKSFEFSPRNQKPFAKDDFKTGFKTINNRCCHGMIFADPTIPSLQSAGFVSKKFADIAFFEPSFA